MAMLCQALKAAETYVDTKEKPRKIVNYLIKTVQNRLRNYVRDTEKRKNLMTILPECEISSDLSDYSETAMSLDGRRIPKDPYCRVTNYNRDF